MSITNNPGLKIVLPITKEDGWTVSSPGEAIKQRLQARSPKKSPKSPEELKAAVFEKEERAAAIHQLHVDAVRRRAARDIERVAEADRRRLRAAAAEKQRIVDKSSAMEKKANDKREAMEAQAAEKRAKREALKQAFFESRACMAAAKSAQLEAAEARTSSAAAKRHKLLQATVHKANYEVKHAIAVATAAREAQREAAVQASTSLDERLAAATTRRLELRESPPPRSPTKEAGSSSSSSSSWGPSKKSARERARQVAQVLNDEAVGLELKRKRLAEAMDKALVQRAARLEATVRRAAAYKEKAARAKAHLAARQAEADDLAHQIVEKGQAATVRRLLHLRAPSLKKLAATAAVIVIDVKRRNPGAAAPLALLERLTAKPAVDAAALAQRHAAATERRAAAFAEKKTKASTRGAGSRHERAAARRAATLEGRTAALAAKELKVAVAVADAKLKRRGAGPAKAAAAAAAKRAAAHYVALGALHAKAQKRDAAAAKRAALRAPRVPTAKRFAAAAANRFKAAEQAVARGEVAAARVAGASERREFLLSERVAKAQMSALPRTTAVKLTATEAGGVHVSVVQGSATPAAVDKVARLMAADDDKGTTDADAAALSGAADDPVMVATDEIEAPAPGFLGRLVGRLFG